MPENNKLGADIISLGKGANINHIVNLIRVVQGYIEVNFSYSPKKAKAVSYFILIYNAVNRNNFDYIKNNFTEGTIQYLEKYKYVGIDTHYKNWRGKTSLVIPLIFDGDLEASEVAKVSQDRVRKEKK